MIPVGRENQKRLLDDLFAAGVRVECFCFEADVLRVIVSSTSNVLKKFGSVNIVMEARPDDEESAAAVPVSKVCD